MTEKEKYALDWNNSAQYFYDHNSYKHLVAHISKFKTVLEIGCGTGQSTLALLEAGHSVIAIDQNAFCIEKAKQLIKASGYSVIENIGDLALFVSMATCTVSNILAARLIISRCPFVIGSKLPGYTAIFLLILTPYQAQKY